MVDHSAKANHGPLQEIDFSGLILGFSSAALSYMGVSENAGDSVRNLDLARQNIDLIALLAEKTRGNLTAEESKLLNQVLSDLRLRFVEASK